MCVTRWRVERAYRKGASGVGGLCVSGPNRENLVRPATIILPRLFEKKKDILIFTAPSFFRFEKRANHGGGQVLSDRVILIDYKRECLLPT